MIELTFLCDLAAVMAVSAVIAVLFHFLCQPVVLGYLVAGMIIGPHTPPFALVMDLQTIHPLAELGIVLLLFSLELSFPEEHHRTWHNRQNYLYTPCPCSKVRRFLGSMATI